jgi:hypothetical protein
MLATVATTAGGREFAVFWPKVGASYAGDLLVIGRAVNGWIDRWVPAELHDPLAVAATARASGEGLVNGDQLGWVLDRWRPTDGGYSTASSQFWQTVRYITQGLQLRQPDWPSQIAWTNLAKVAPWAGGNPGSAALRIQRQLGLGLIRQEVEELRPLLVVALTGRWWFEPFANALGLPMSWRTGLVEGVAQDVDRTWVVAVHPMTRSPRAVADSVLAAAGETL